MNTYYQTGDAEEIETILRAGFIDNTKRKDTGQLGVYVADSRSTFQPEGGAFGNHFTCVDRYLPLEACIFRIIPALGENGLYLPTFSMNTLECVSS